MDLVKKVEILEKTDKKRGDVSIILDLIDNSFSRNIELLAITISKNTVTIKGVAPMIIQQPMHFKAARG